jgi:hypothetical protein
MANSSFSFCSILEKKYFGKRRIQISCVRNLLQLEICIYLDMLLPNSAEFIWSRFSSMGSDEPYSYARFDSNGHTIAFNFPETFDSGRIIFYIDPSPFSASN